MVKKIMIKNPRRFDIEIFQGVNALLVINQVLAQFDEGPPDFKYQSQLNDEERTLLLARPEKFFLRDRRDNTDLEVICYEKINETGQTARSYKRGEGAIIFVTYDRKDR